MANKSNKSWIQDHINDPFVKKAQVDGYRSRAVYKLLEIHERYHLFKPGMTVIDLGAAPGGWSQVLAKILHTKGEVIALDLLPMEPIPNVKFIQGDFTEEKVYQELSELIVPQSVDWVVSDMAPNLSGNESVDIPRSIYLCELALDFAVTVLKPGNGGVLLKIFQGEGFDAYLAQLRQRFEKVIINKPKASRGKSREIYLVARCLKK